MSDDATQPVALSFVKGHGTHNDFVVLPDPGAHIDLTPDLVRALCHRRGGLGADGVLRVVPAALAGEASESAGGQGSSPAAEWFMDYRNSDGSVAEMCGNGIRVFARYLVGAGLASPGELLVATRAGPRRVRVGSPDQDIVADMGPPTVLDRTSTVTVDGRQWHGTAVSMGNPHLAVPVADLAEAGALTAAPTVEADRFPDGVNVEFVLGRGPGHIAMRVFERGVGETQSCGTGACAAAVAAATWWDYPRPLDVVVDVPGGRLRIVEDADGRLWLSGNAILVARGEVDLAAMCRPTAVG